MNKRAPMLWVLKRIRRRLPILAVMTLTSIANAVLGVVFALGTKGVINSAISGNQEQFLRACGIQLAIICGILLTLTVKRILTDRITADLDRDWKRDLMHGLLHGDYVAVSAYHSGELLNRLNNDVRILDTSIISILPNTASMITRLVSAVAVLVAMEPMFCLVVVAAGIVVVVTTAIMRHNLKGLNKRVSESEGRLSGFLQETLEKLLMVQAMDVSAEMEKRAEKHMEVRYVLQRKRRNIQVLANTCVSVLSYGASFGALVFCAHGLLNHTMDFGTLTAVTQLISQLQGPLVNMSGIMPQYVAMVAAAERLMELEALNQQAPAAQLEPEPVYARMESIDAKALNFAYDRDRVFTDAEFSVKKGQFGVILGHSGIGKSTLLKIMLGIFHPASGGVYVSTPDGHIQLDRTTRRLFAYVPQGNLLISGTLRENLILTRPDATQAEIDHAVHISAMDDYLPSLPKGLDTVIGESAAGLSEGQAQRLSIARAILSDAPILLLDEATSALDAETEAVVLQRLSSLPNKTCIAVTHRPAAIALSDWTMEMCDGKCLVRKTEK